MIRKIVREAKADDYKWSSIMLGDRQERAVPDEEIPGAMMVITKKALPRRTVLRGLGTTLALPLLDAMVPALATRAEPRQAPTRLSIVYRAERHHDGQVDAGDRGRRTSS